MKNIAIIALLALSTNYQLAAYSETLDEEAQRVTSEHATSLSNRSFLLKGLTKLYVSQASLSNLAIREMVAQLKQVDVVKQELNDTSDMRNDEAGLSIAAVQEDNGTFVELNLYELCVLDRERKRVFSTNVYHDQSYVHSGQMVQGVREVMSRFVINFLKANAIAR